MSKPEENDKTYYAIKNNEENASETGGKWKATASNLEVGSIALANAQAGDKVTCSTSVQVALTGTMADALQEGDAFINLSGLGITGVDSIDLFTYKNSGNNKTYTGSLELTGATETQKLTADVWIVNKQNEEQNHLAGKELTVTLTIQAQDCKTTSEAAD